MLNYIPDRVAGWFIENRSAQGKTLYVVDENGCWIWQRAVAKNGYGVIGWQESGRVVRTVAHRVAYLALVGPIGEDLELDHVRCVRACINPAHLEPVTGEENNLRGNPPNTHCLRGHLMDEANVRVYRGTRHCRACRRVRGQEKKLRGVHWSKR